METSHVALLRLYTWSRARPDNTTRHFCEKQRHGNSRTLYRTTGYSCIRSVTGVLDSHGTATLLKPFSVSLSSFASWNTDDRPSTFLSLSKDCYSFCQRNTPKIAQRPINDPIGVSKSRITHALRCTVGIKGSACCGVSFLKIMKRQRVKRE